MNKAEFVAKYSEKTEENKKRSDELVDAFLETVEQALHNHEAVQFIGWGSFEVKKTAARKGRNPKTGAEIQIPAKSVVHFKAGKGLADKVNEKK